VRAHIIRALDALEVGDQREATEILLYALEDIDIPRPFACQHCGLRFCWPGELDDHLRVSHRFEAAA
jgi:hypothetical protein